MTERKDEAVQQHELVDFMALAAVKTNEQKILACLERSEALLIKLVEASSWTPRTVPLATIEAAKPGSRRK